MSLDHQVFSLFAVTNGYVDGVPVEQVKKWETDLHAYMDANHAEIGQNIMRSGTLPDESVDSLRLALDDFNKSWSAD